MAKYCETTHPQKVMGLYGQLARALNALMMAGEFPVVDEGILGIVAEVRQDPATGEWSVVQA